VNIAAMLCERARQQPESIALIDTKHGRDRVVSFGALDAITARVASEIAARGIHQGDGILILHPMAIELYVFLIALFRVGAVGMFLDPSAGRNHVDRCLSIYSPRAFFGSWKAQMLRLWTPSVRHISTAFCTSRLPATHFISLRGEANSDHRIADVEDTTPALITFTSGSTGQPKAALRSHGFLIAQQDALQESLCLRPGDSDLTTLPIFVLSNLASGVTSVLPDADMRAPGKIHARPVLDQIDRHPVATSAASPAFIRRLTQECERTHRGIPQMRHVFIGGAPVFPSDLRQARSLFPNAEITAVYGSTEAEPMADVHLSQIAEEDFLAMERGSGLLGGAPVASIALRILRDQWGTPIGPMTQQQFEALCLAPEAVGEIVVSGRHVLPGYLNGEGDAETKFDVDGVRWHRTGDLGRLDERGRLWLMGRASAAIHDSHGLLYPFAAECAAMQVLGVRRAAILQVAGRRVLAVEADRAGVSDALAQAMAWAHLHEVRVLASIPMDKRHNAKIDYGSLSAILSKPQRRLSIWPAAGAGRRTG
jgi:acyl-CoA synthetase (AMP-forming)/AMP-acid ligase II